MTLAVLEDQNTRQLGDGLDKRSSTLPLAAPVTTMREGHPEQRADTVWHRGRDERPR